MKNLRSATLRDLGKVSLSKDNVLDEVFLRFVLLAQTSLAQKALMLYDAGQYADLVDLEFDFDFNEVEHFWGRRDLRTVRLDYQISAFFKKRTDIDIGADRELAAFNKWLATETSCTEVNERFRQRWSGATCSTPPVESVIMRARQKITSILGVYDPKFVRENARFGPGSDIGTEGHKTSWYDKYSSPGYVTPWAREFVKYTLNEGGDDVRVALVDEAKPRTTSRLSFVPKNAKIDRAICVEPRWNIFVQLGVGELMKKRLRRIGIDITDQSRNQGLAERAWVDGLATIDLSSASDTVSTNLCIDLLSDADEQWIDAILKLRCHYTKYRGVTYRLEKVSSMGNGYTFPLETLIFYALAYACCVELKIDPTRIANQLSVYGDDIIAPQEAAGLLLEVLEYVGFKPNRQKTFITGVFYESCGSDFFCGKNIRPVFQEEAVCNVEQAFTFVNQLAALAGRFADCPGFASREVWDLRELVIRRIPKSLRLFGPPDAGDGVIHSTFDVARPQLSPDMKGRGWSGFWVTGLVPMPVKRYGVNYFGHLYSKLHGVTDAGNFVVRRGTPVRQKRKVYVLNYTDVTLI